MQHLQPNTTLQGGKYRIEGVLGQGGFGITYMAENVYAHKHVAIYVILPILETPLNPMWGLRGVASM